MNCQRMREAMFMVSDDEAGDELLVSLRRHLGDCPECAAYFEYVNKFLTVVRERCCRYEAPSRLRHRILDSLPHRRRSSLGALD